MSEIQIPLHIDSTTITTFRSCQTKARYEFFLGLRPHAIGIDLHAGACFATGIETLYRALYEKHASRDDAYGETEFEFLKAWGDFETIDPASPKSRDNVLAALYSYASTYNPPYDHVEPFLNKADLSPFEFTFAIPLDHSTTGLDFPLHPSGSPFIYTGRFDMLGLWNSVPVIRDEKTAACLEQNWSEKWSLRSQFLGYVWAMQALGWNLDTVVVRGIILYKSREATHVEAIKSYPRFLVERWLLQLRADLTHLIDAFASGFFESSLGDACTAYRGCPYVQLCSASNPEEWFSSYTVRFWSPLNRNPLSPKEPPSHDLSRTLGSPRKSA